MGQVGTGPVSGPEVWTGADLAQLDDWRFAVDDEQAEDLQQATSATSVDALPFSVTRERFPLRAATRLTAAIQHALRFGRGLCRVSGMPVNGMDGAGWARMLWGLGTHIGAAEPQDAAGSLLHEVRDTGLDLDDGNVRYYQTRRAIGFHNDGADAFLLLCVNPASQGGESRVVSTTAVFNELLRREPELAVLLQQDFHFDLRGQHERDAKPFQAVPIFTPHAGQIHALYKRGYIDTAQRLAGVPALSKQQIAALDLLDAVCDELAYDFSLQRGDLLAGNNYLVFHDRRAFVDAPSAADSALATRPLPPRFMLRLWLSVRGGAGVAPAFANTREFQHSHARHLAWGSGR